MKRFLILSLAALSFLSCSDSDDTEKADNLDPIIGTWKLEKLVETDTNGDEIDGTNTCTTQSKLVFNANGITTSELVGGPDMDGKCQSDGEKTGTWLNNGNNEYQVLEEGETTPEVFTITFEDNNTKFTSGSVTWRKQ
ncbi:lipocalin-like domain-containing protein [Tenacibaculum agarivorans]|uniref:lipocalin family protein n=1 Tax=Tenacibaculum agarivorans TaxID=1908389 RepID=UPI00094B8771|nr:lipocalin family protein [Tenacibaculum agarivorans]